ncbi:FecR family protein [Aquimarina sp. 2201CG5-10]|uniref:FecR family protein n=1 Tax=Aquimarina callyspongiae TaxID=3098150 RepID=UPI002AB37C45|nr:FecR family protein [Aquimarina sp. 2201CG5-10]MDY8137669.1 FecR family protein [Aquimarina sp. 2201CG5-10]
MLDDKKDDIFLSRWISGELSTEELKEFQAHPEYGYYMKIMAGADALDLKDYDVDKELVSLKSKREVKSINQSTRIIKLWPYLAVAASVIIILGVFLFNPNESFNTNYGEQLAVTLPDGSEMILNAKSTASFDEDDWNNNRTITLEGEAYFKVKKGSKFTVTTKNGDVSVLGTQFNVQSDTSIFEAICYEGKVSVTNGQNYKILTAGNAYRNIINTAPEHWTFVAQKPSWIDNTSSFRSVPVKYVFKELEEQYNLQIDTTKIDTEIIYTGTFPNDNIKVALKTVFSTLGIEYSLSKDGKTVVLEK